MSNKGKIIIVVAPSGTGKTTLIEKILTHFSTLEWSVSYTTRSIREGEVHGEDYFFISTEEFKEKIDANHFAEWALVHGNYYGTDKSFVTQKTEQGISILFDVDVQGVDLLKKVYGDEAKAIFIEPPSVAELRRRLEKRGTDAQEVIERRLANSIKELERKNDFDYLVMNDEFDKAYQDLEMIIEKILEGSC